MKRLGWMTLLLAAAAGLAGCAEEDDDGDGESGSGSESASGSGSQAAPDPKCYSVETNTTGTGEQACGDVICAPGTYCEGTFFNQCDPGCLGSANCAPGEYCNQDAGTIGICTTPGTNLEVQCAGPPCSLRCPNKAASCGFSEQVINDVCPDICSSATSSQLDCLEVATCGELEAGLGTEGGGVCGIGQGSE